jgi:hypothetical protein
VSKESKRFREAKAAAPTSSAGFSPTLQAAVATLLVTIGVTAAYWNSLYVPFVYDDREAIVINPHVRSLWPLTSSMWAPPDTTASGRPMLSLSLAVNYRIGKYNVTGYHVLNVVIHILAAMAMYGVLRRTLLSETLRSRFGRHAFSLSLIATLIWAMHPLHTESVTYVIQRCESMMGLFLLLMLYCAIRSAGRPLERSGRAHFSPFRKIAAAYRSASSS